MDFLTTSIIFVLGAIIGSFLNVVIYRYNSGASPLTGRSQCFSCGKTLVWYELVPLLSFLLQRGRCRKCHVRLSWQYPLVEVLTGIIFVALFALGKPLAESIWLATIFSTLIVIGAYDIRHQIIPDSLVAFFAIDSLAWFLWLHHANLGEIFQIPYLWTLLAGPVLFAPFWALWFVSKGKWIGLGDGKLAIGIGWFLGLSLGGSAIMLAFWIGTLWALAMMTSQRLIAQVAPAHVHKMLSMRSAVAFGPFLILGVFVVYFTGVNLFDGSVSFFNF